MQVGGQSPLKETFANMGEDSTSKLTEVKLKHTELTSSPSCPQWKTASMHAVL